MAKRKPGRPAFAPTLKQRETVAVAAGGGMSHEEIAIGLGIDRKTLEKHFEHELSVGAYEKRLEVLNAMHATAVKGNVTAQKAYVALTPAAAAPPLPPLDPPQPQQPEGKKAQAQAAAKTAQAGTDWDNLLPKTVQ